MLEGVDVSHFNGRVDASFLDAAGIRWAYYKAHDTHGTNASRLTASAWWRTNAPSAERANLVVGGYSRVFPEFGKTAKQSAQGLVSVLAERGWIGSGFLPPMLDFEHVPAGWTASQIADWAETWMEELMRLTSLAGTLYCSRSFLDTNLYSVKAHPLYLAAWAPRTGPWSSAREAWTAFNNTQTSYLFDGPVTLWQYSATGVIPGAHESPNIDRGLMWGNEATLEALLYRKRYHGDISDVE